MPRPEKHAFSTFASFATTDDLNSTQLPQGIIVGTWFYGEGCEYNIEKDDIGRLVYHEMLRDGIMLEGLLVEVEFEDGTKWMVASTSTGTIRLRYDDGVVLSQFKTLGQNMWSNDITATPKAQSSGIIASFASSIGGDIAAAKTEITRLGEGVSDFFGVVGVATQGYRKTPHAHRSASGAAADEAWQSNSDSALCTRLPDVSASQVLMQQMELLIEKQRCCQYDIARNNGLLEEVAEGQLKLFTQQQRLEKKFLLLATQQGYILNKVKAVEDGVDGEQESIENISEVSAVQRESVAAPLSASSIAKLFAELDSGDDGEDTRLSGRPNRGVTIRTRSSDPAGHSSRLPSSCVEATSMASMWSCERNTKGPSCGEISTLCQDNSVCCEQRDIRREASFYRTTTVGAVERDAADVMRRRDKRDDSLGNQCNVKVSPAVDALFGKRTAVTKDDRLMPKAQVKSRSASDESAACQKTVDMRRSTSSCSTGGGFEGVSIEAASSTSETPSTTCSQTVPAQTAPSPRVVAVAGHELPMASPVLVAQATVAMPAGLQQEDNPCQVVAAALVTSVPIAETPAEDALCGSCPEVRGPSHASTSFVGVQPKVVDDDAPSAAH